MKFSIIIPVYRAEKYLSQCLDSLIKQTYSFLEILCVNDCAADSSYPILKKYAEMDERIKIIDYKDKGVSDARNVGIANANGEYLLFVDSDDFVKETMCENLLQEINKYNADTIYFNYYSFSNEQKRPINMINSKSDEFKNILIPGLWCKAYKRDFIVNNNINFPVEINIAEDMLFVLKVLSKKPSISYLDKYLYYYRNDNSSSATHYRNKYVNPAPYKYWFETEEYKRLDNLNKLVTIDFFAKQIFGGWSSFYSKETKKENDLIINDFLQYYKNFNYKEYKNLTGYKRLKHKQLWRLLKNIRIFINNFVYRNKI